jgi:hypothetical protein
VEGGSAKRAPFRRPVSAARQARLRRTRAHAKARSSAKRRKAAHARRTNLPPVFPRRIAVSFHMNSMKQFLRCILRGLRRPRRRRRTAFRPSRARGRLLSPRSFRLPAALAAAASARRRKEDPARAEALYDALPDRAEEACTCSSGTRASPPRRRRCCGPADARGFAANLRGAGRSHNPRASRRDAGTGRCSGNPCAPGKTRLNHQRSNGRFSVATRALRVNLDRARP